MDEITFTAEQWDEIECIIASAVASVLRKHKVRGQGRRDAIAAECAATAFHFRAEGVYVEPPY